MSYQKLLIIAILLSLVIIFLKKIMFTESDSNNVNNGVNNNVIEDFDSNVLSELEIMNQQDPSIQKKIIFDSVDTSLELGRGKQGKLVTSNSNINDNLLNLYVNNMINADRGNPNKMLVTNNEELPKAPNNNWAKYNHEMRILIDSKKIKQDYLIKVLKSKLNILRNSLNNMQEVTDKYDLDKLTQ
jgi:hypothetical protein